MMNRRRSSVRKVPNANEWKSFIEAAKAKASKHTKKAAEWEQKDTILSLILVTITAATAITVALKEVPYPYPCIFSTLGTIMTLFCRKFNADGKRQKQLDLSKAFISLSLRMIRCETQEDYENLWKEYNYTVVYNQPMPTEDGEKDKDEDEDGEEDIEDGYIERVKKMVNKMRKKDDGIENDEMLADMEVEEQEQEQLIDGLNK